MKFLLFNLVVVAALVHLFSGETARIGDTVDAVMAKVQSATIATPETPTPTTAATSGGAPAISPSESYETDPPATPPMQTAESLERPAPLAVPGAAPETAPETTTSPPPLPEPRMIEQPRVHEAPNPEVAARRDAVLWGDVVPNLTPDTFPDAFAESPPSNSPTIEDRRPTNEDRRQALLTLAEDMELFSLEQLNP